MIETWKDIRGYEGVYQVSDAGHVRLLIDRRGVKAGHVISPFQMHGYTYVRLRLGGKSRVFLLHRLMLETFKPRPNAARLTAIHDNDRLNDNRLENLVWCTQAEAQARRRVRVLRGEDVKLSKLTSAAVREIRRLYAEGFQQSDIAGSFGVNQATVSRVVSGRSWRHVA